MSTAAGVDVGSEAIKGIVLSASAAAPVEVVAAGTLPLGELGHMEDSPDKTLAIGVKLKELVRSARLRAHYRRVGVSGKATSIRYLQVPPVPPWRLDMLVKYEVQERASDKEANTYDYQILDVPEVAGQYTVMIGVLREAAAADLLSLGRAGGLGEVEIDLEALALYSAYFHGHGFDSDKTVLVADVGADDLTILLCRNGGLYFARTVLGAGRRFTQVLADELKLDLLDADELKKRQGEIVFDIAPLAARSGRIARPGASAVAPRAGGAAQPAGAEKQGADELRLQEPSRARPADKAESATAEPLLADIPEIPPAADELGTATPPVLSAVQKPDADKASPGPAAPAAQLAEKVEAIPLLARSGTAVVPLVETPEDRRRRQISNALVREAAALCAALENAVLVCKQQTKMREIKVDRLYVTGGGSRLKGLAEFMSRRMRVEVAPLEPFRQLSLDRLAPEQAAALKAEQHNLAVATGLALGGLQKRALSFLLWPEALKQRKDFWSRGAYLHYAAALAVIALALFLFTPFRNLQALSQNFETSEEAVNRAQVEKSELTKLEADNDEKRAQLKQIADNTLSGHYFLNLLAELKNTARITDDIYLTQISTTMPEVVRRAAGKEGLGGEAPAAASTPRLAAKAAAADPNATPDTFQTQRQIYLRGFVRGDEKGDTRIVKIRDFYQRLLPYPDDPDNPANLFKDVRPIWFSTEDLRQADYYLTEFVLEAYTEGTREKAAKKPEAAAKPTAVTERRDGSTSRVVPDGGAPVAPAPGGVPAGAGAPVQPAPQGPAQPAAPDGEKKPVKKKYVLPSAPPRDVPPALPAPVEGQPAGKKG